MNNPSEWTKLFDQNVGRYRYKHKGSGLIRDTLMAIGKAFKGTAKNVVKTAADKPVKTVAEKAGQKVGEIAVEKGSKQIQQILRKRKPKPQKVCLLETTFDENSKSMFPVAHGLRPWQMEQTLGLTLNQRRSTVLFR